jgi:hypothetical protein
MMINASLTLDGGGKRAVRQKPRVYPQAALCLQEEERDMKFRKLLAGAVAALSISAYTNPAQSTIVDLAFIMDMSGSVASSDYLNAMDALADALEASIPTNDPNNRYSITVISFDDQARLDRAPVLVEDATDLATVTSAIRTATYRGGATCYSCAFNLLSSTVTTFNDFSIINMMTDGEPNTGISSQAGLLGITTGLRTAGWDSLSFEAVEEFGTPPDSNLLSAIAFDTAGIGGQPIFNDPNQITDPLNAAFVLEVSGFGTAYAQAISTKVQRIVDPNVVPLPAGLPLLLAGIGAFVLVRSRQSA